jgi:Gram-negative bacterial TonB protein C-terminal
MSVLTPGLGGREGEPARTREPVRSRLQRFVDPSVRAPWATAVAISLVIHAFVTFFWRLPAADAPAALPARSPSALPIVFEPIAPPPARPLRVVVVGPKAGDGSLGGRALTSTGPRRAHGHSSVSTSVAMSSAAISAPEPTTVQEPPRATADLPADEADALPGAPAAGQSVPAPALPAENAAGRTFEELIRAQGLRLAGGRGTGKGGFGVGDGPAGFALSVDVSGHRVVDSRVVASPVVVREQRIHCELPVGRLRTVVRLLVMRDGTGAAPRVLETSGHASFDTCAIRYALGLRFTPGIDGAGNPLDVWVHVGITPSLTNPAR